MTNLLAITCKEKNPSKTLNDPEVGTKDTQKTLKNPEKSVGTDGSEETMSDAKFFSEGIEKTLTGPEVTLGKTKLST